MEISTNTQRGLSSFDVLLTRNVPHILEMIFLSLDYESFKSCLEVSNTWMKMLRSESFNKRAKYLFQKEIAQDEVKLWQKSWAGDKNGVKRLLLIGLLDVNHVQIDFYKPQNALTSLGAAASEGHKQVVQVLLEKGAHLNKAHKLALTPLQKTVSAGHEEVVQLLLDWGADPNVKDEYGWTPLHEAASEGKTCLVTLLLERGANPNASNKYGETPLHLASTKTVVQLLLNRGAELDKRDKSGRTPLHSASRRRKKVLVDLLLQKGANQSRRQTWSDPTSFG